MGKVLYSDIQRKTREVRALVRNKKYGAAERAAESLRADLKAFIDATYFRPPAIEGFTLDPTVLADSAVEHAESAHPLTLELVVAELHTLLERMTQCEEVRERQVAV